MISCGNYHAMVINEDGFLRACCFNLGGQIGFEDSKKKELTLRMSYVTTDL